MGVQRLQEIINNVIEFNMQANTKQWEKNLKLQGCPSDVQDKVKEVVTEYWYVFCDDEFHRPNQGFSFHIDTGNHPHICCKPPK